MKAIVILAFAAVIVATPASAEVLRVPSQYPAIQDAINAAADADIIIVAPGTYGMDINFAGKNVVLISEQGPWPTIIDGAGGGNSIRFCGGEGRGAIISGFTIANHGAGYYGAIIAIDSSPVIANNIFRDNFSWESGAGIFIEGGAPAVINNIFYHNEAWMTEACSGGSGIFVEAGSPDIWNNLFSDNINAYGAGIMACADTSRIFNNIFYHDQGQGIHADGSEALIWQNTFVRDDFGYCMNLPDLVNNIFHQEGASGGYIDNYNFYGNAEFASGPWGPFYLSQVAAGQPTDSPGVDAGTPLNFLLGTTRTDHVADAAPHDLGYHFPLRLPPTIARSLPRPLPLIPLHQLWEGNVPLAAHSFPSYSSHSSYLSFSRKMYLTAGCVSDR